jgi:aminoglycoside phosphotransferase (APT) family kinase protein
MGPAPGIRVHSMEMNIQIHHAHQFDVTRLEKWCQTNVADFGTVREIVQISGGVSNPTFFLTTRDGQNHREYVLRKQPPGKLLPSAHQVDREHRIMTALNGSGVPVPCTRALCVDTDVIGTTFYVMERLHGRVLSEVSLPNIARLDRSVIYDQLAEVLARLHRVDYDACGLSDFGRPGNFFERQIQRWIKQYRGAQTEEILAMDRLIDYLPANIPEDDTTTIVHGDYRLGNVMFHPTQPRMIAVLDWELSTLGHPFADVAYCCLMWEFDRGSFGFLNGIDIEALGIPQQTEFVSNYLRHAGRRSVKNWNFYLGFSMFRLAAIKQGVYRRMLNGNVSSAEPVENTCPEMARQALEIVERGPLEITA